MQIITPDTSVPVGPYSSAIKANGFIFVSGQIGLIPGTTELVKGGAQEQTAQCLENMSAVLTAAGSSLSGVAKTTVLLTDMTDYEVVNDVYVKAFGIHKPARACFAVKSLPKGALVEIEAVAV